MMIWLPWKCLCYCASPKWCDQRKFQKGLLGSWSAGDSFFWECMLCTLPCPHTARRYCILLMDIACVRSVLLIFIAIISLNRFSPNHELTICSGPEACTISSVKLQRLRASSGEIKWFLLIKHIPIWRPNNATSTMAGLSYQKLAAHAQNAPEVWWEF